MNKMYFYLLNPDAKNPPKGAAILAKTLKLIAWNYTSAILIDLNPVNKVINEGNSLGLKRKWS